MTTIDALIADLGSPDRLLRNKAVWSLKKLGEAARSAVPALKLLLDDHDEQYIRICAAGAIGKIAPEEPAAVPVLIEGLSDPIGLHRAAACEFLGDMKHKTAVLRTMQLFNDPDFIVRFAAAKSVGRTFGEWMHATAMCVEMLKDSSETSRVIGAECLLSIRRYVRDHLDLLEMAIADDAPWEVRLNIEEILAELRKQ